MFSFKFAVCFIPPYRQCFQIYSQCELYQNITYKQTQYVRISCMVVLYSSFYIRPCICKL